MAFVQRLRTEYEAWWADLLPSFSDDCEITLGNPADNPAILTAHDWMLPGETLSPWNHSAIRAQKGEPEGYWAVNVESAGRYRIDLRRWPLEADHPIAADLPPGADVPGVPAYRTTPGVGFPAQTATLQIADLEKETPVAKDATHARFEIDLPAGITRLQGSFIAADGKRLGSYYAIVTKL